MNWAPSHAALRGPTVRPNSRTGHPHPTQETPTPRTRHRGPNTPTEHLAHAPAHRVRARQMHREAAMG